MRLGYLFSVLIHISFFLIICLTSLFSILDTRYIPETVSVELQPQKQRVLLQTGQTGTTKTIRHMKQSLPRIGTTKYLQRPDKGVDRVEKNNDFLNGTGFRGQSGYGQATDPGISLYKYIYNKIDNNLTYPMEFIENGFFGQVAAKLNFNENGDYVYEISKFESANAYLRVHVIRTLRNAFVDTIPDQVNKIKKPFSINCSFRFDINYHGDADTIASQKWLSGNNLFFYKTFAKAVLSWKLGPLSGLGPGVGLNPLWFIEQAKQLFSKKAKIDPLQKYRDDPEW